MFLDTTAQVIIALKCVAQQPHHAGSRILSKIKRSIKFARRYLKLKIKHFMDSLWIGNKHSTAIALSALRVVNRNLTVRAKKKER